MANPAVLNGFGDGEQEVIAALGDRLGVNSPEAVLASKDDDPNVKLGRVVAEIRTLVGSKAEDDPERILVFDALRDHIKLVERSDRTDDSSDLARLLQERIEDPSGIIRAIHAKIEKSQAITEMKTFDAGDDALREGVGEFVGVGGGIEIECDTFTRPAGILLVAYDDVGEWVFAKRVDLGKDLARSPEVLEKALEEFNATFGDRFELGTKCAAILEGNSEGVPVAELQNILDKVWDWGEDRHFADINGASWTLDHFEAGAHNNPERMTMKVWMIGSDFERDLCDDPVLIDEHDSRLGDDIDEEAPPLSGPEEFFEGDNVELAINLYVDTEEAA